MEVCEFSLLKASVTVLWRNLKQNLMVKKKNLSLLKPEMGQEEKDWQNVVSGHLGWLCLDGRHLGRDAVLHFYFSPHSCQEAGDLMDTYHKFLSIFVKPAQWHQIHHIDMFRLWGKFLCLLIWEHHMKNKIFWGTMDISCWLGFSRVVDSA